MDAETPGRIFGIFEEFLRGILGATPFGIPSGSLEKKKSEGILEGISGRFPQAICSEISGRFFV